MAYLRSMAGDADGCASGVGRELAEPRPARVGFFGTGLIARYIHTFLTGRSSDLAVFATIAGEPHVSDLSWFSHNPVVLHVSLRDLAPEIRFAWWGG